MIQRGEMELPIYLQHLVLVLDVHAVRLSLVIGEVVAPGVVGMVSTAVLKGVLGDGGLDRGGARGERFSISAEGAVPQSIVSDLSLLSIRTSAVPIMIGKLLVCLHSEERASNSVSSFQP